MTGPPKFLGNPHERVKVFDPGGTWHAKPFRHAGVAFCITTSKTKASASAMASFGAP